VALVQITSARAGHPGPIATAVGSAFVPVQEVVARVADGTRDGFRVVAAVPQLTAQNAALRARAARIAADNTRLREALAAAPAAAAAAALAEQTPGGIEAAVIGYDPEGFSRTIRIDAGTQAGVRPDDGVIAPAGVVGRVVNVEPFSSDVLLATDAGSRIPAIVQRGRWWGIATGAGGTIGLRYVSQDARLRPGDRVVTGNGRSFRAGIPLGLVSAVVFPSGALYKSAAIDPAVDFGRLEHVVVLAGSRARGRDDRAP